MAEIVGAILSKNELPVLHSDVLVRVDKASGGASILQELTKEFSESFQNLNLITLVQVSNENGWSTGLFIVTGEHTSESCSFRNSEKINATIDFRISVGVLTHGTGLPSFW